MVHLLRRRRQSADVDRSARVGEMKKTPAAWRRYLRFWGSDPGRDLDDELRFHLEARYDEFVRGGMDPADARAAVGHRFGDVNAVRDKCSAIDTRWQRERT